ncbi:MAG: hypothetical protein U1E14_18120 [Geminicoccaceae bacterium]
MVAAAALRHDVRRHGDWARRVAGGTLKDTSPAEAKGAPDDDRHFAAVAAFLLCLRSRPALEVLGYLLGLALRVLQREIIDNQSARVVVWFRFWFDHGVNPAKLLALQVWQLANRQPGRRRRARQPARPAAPAKTADLYDATCRRMAVVAGELRKAIWRELAQDAFLAAEGCLGGMPAVDEADAVPDDTDDDELFAPAAPPDPGELVRWVLFGRDQLEAMGFFDDSAPPPPDG